MTLWEEIRLWKINETIKELIAHENAFDTANFGSFYYQVAYLCPTDWLQDEVEIYAWTLFALDFYITKWKFADRFSWENKKRQGHGCVWKIHIVSSFANIEFCYEFSTLPCKRSKVYKTHLVFNVAFKTALRLKMLADLFVKMLLSLFHVSRNAYH